MQRRLLVLLALSVSLSLATLHAEEATPTSAAPQTPSPSATRIVGSVYGKAVTAADVKLTKTIDPAVKFDARDQAQWELMGRIQIALGKPIVERFVKDQKIAATPQEIELFHKNSRAARQQQLRELEDRLAKLKSELATPNLAADKQAELRKEQQTVERSLAVRAEMKGDTPDAIAEKMIATWKTERELHRKYGGQVIFQQFGPEALDARRLLFEEAEKSGDLKFNDPGVRHMFYYYANMKHTAIDGKALEEPWFLRDGT